MGGKMQHQQSIDFKDPFNAGQMVGMLVMLTFIENNDGISQEMLDRIKEITAENAQAYLEKPAEDIFLMVDNLAKELQ